MNGSWHLSLIIIFSTVSVFFTIPMASAQVDIILDCDGIAPGAMDGCNTSQEVTTDSPLTPFPTGLPADGNPPGTNAGIDWFDRDNSKTWTVGDDLHAEDTATCPSAIRDGDHDPGADCPILDLDGNLGFFIKPDSGFGSDLVDCDLETGGSPSGQINPPFGFPPPPPPCQDTRPGVQITFFDLNNDGFWNDGEDIVLDFNGNLIFDPPTAVGGKFLDVDKTTLIVAGAKNTTSWLIPFIVSAIGIGLLVGRKI
jgi:hypothetical protein